SAKGSSAISTAWALPSSSRAADTSDASALLSATEAFQRGGFALIINSIVMARRVRSGSVRTGHPGDTTPMPKTYYVYILASKRCGTSYIRVASGLARRVSEHREGLVAGCTKTYGVRMLVYFEAFDSIEQAIHREKRLKKYKREWKMNLIQQHK